MTTPNQSPSAPEHRDSPVQKVLDAIKQRGITVRPKWRVVLQHALTGAAVVLVAVGLVYLGSFVTYLWRSARFSSLPAFGPEGYGVLVNRFPWWHLAIILLAAAAFVYLLRRSTHLYRWPLAATLGMFVVAFIAAAALTDSTRVHDRLANRTEHGQFVPIVGGLYPRGGVARGLVTPAVIKKIGDDSWTVVINDENVKVEINNRTMIPGNWSPSVGDEIVVIGEREDQTIEAVGIRPANSLPPRRHFRVPAQNEIPFEPPSYY